MAVDYYEILGVSPDAPADEIKKSFRRLAREHHPDATGGDHDSQERYKQLSEAYAVLSDPEKRRQYDLARQGMGQFGSPFATTIEDIFESFFGGAPGGTRTRQRTRAQRGESIEVALTLTLAETVFGAEKTIRFERFEPCETCDGTGCTPGSHPQRCSACEGTGQLQQVRRTVLGSLVTSYPCAQCRQTGWVVPDPCADCSGEGRMSEQVEFPIEVPPGVEEGDRLRVTGEGEAGVAAGGRGDLYVRFHVEVDERFERAGEHLLTWAEVPMTTATLGGRVSFESLDGTEEIDVPPGTQSGETFRIRGRGFPTRYSRGRGDLVVRVHVATPTDLDAGQRKLIEELAESRSEPHGTQRGFLATLRRALGMET